MMDLDFEDMATPIPMDEDFEQPSQTDLFESVIGRGYGESEDGAFSDSEEEEEVYARSGGDFPKTTEQRINRQEQLRMLHLRRYLDQLSEKVLEKDYIVQKTRQELQKCRERLEQLERERDQVFAQISACDAEGNVSAVNRLQAQHERVLQELEDEETLEEKIKETLDSAEYELAKAQVEQGKFLLADEELRKKEEQLKEEKLQMAQTRKKKEDHFAAQTEKRRRAREKEHIEAIRERERRQRQAMLDAKKSREKAKVYLKETMARIRSQDLAEEQKNREEMEKRMSTALSLKTDIMKNRENLKALQARDRAVERAAKEAEERERQRILEEGGNPEEALLREKRQAEFDNLKEQHESRQRQHQVEIAQRILLEEQRMKKRMIQQPQLWNDPKREKAKRVAPHKRRKLRIFQESESSSHEYSGDVEDENRPPLDPRVQMDSSDEEKGVHSSPYGTISRAELPDSDSETEANVDLAKPEFEGMWDKHKPYRVPKDAAEPIIKHPGASKMEQDIMVKVLDRHRENIVSKQVAAGREFKGCPFYSKPDVIHFKDFDVGKSYKKKVTLTNVSYTVNYCKLLGITEHLKDFIDVLFDPPGQMSAGLTCEMLVTFKPMINEDLEGEVNFLAQTGPFSIPIKCTTKKCDLSVDTRVIDFGTTVIGETLKRTFTLTNNGALGTRFEFVKISGMKQRNISTAETSIGRLTTADTARVPSPLGEAQEDKKGKGKKAAKEAATQDKEKDKAPARPAEAEAPQETEAHKEKVTLKEPGLESEITSTVGFPLSTEAEELDSFDGMKVGQLIGGEIGPFTSLKLEIFWNPTYPGAVDSDFLVTFTDELSAEISVKALGNAIDVPVWVQRQSVDLKICMYDRLYQDTIIANNRATTALRLNFDVPKELKNHLELLPKTGYIQAQSQFQAQLKFLPRSTLFEDAGKYFDKETGVLEAPMTIRVADQTNPVPFTLHAVVTNSDLEFDITNIDFGYCTIYESVKTTVKLSNRSILPQEFGFVGIPEYIDVQPNDGFGTLLPMETMELDIIFSPPKARNYSFELTCKSLINRSFKIACTGIGVHPPLDLSNQIIHFRATALTDVSTATIHVINSHTSMNEYTHPVPRIGKGAIAPVGPTSFEFVVPEGAPLTVSPAVGTVEPGKQCRVVLSFSPKLRESEIADKMETSCCVRVRYTPSLPDSVVRKEAVRMAVRELQAKAEKEYQEELQREKENQEQAAKKKGPAGKGKPSPKGKPKGGAPLMGETVPSGPAPVKAPPPESIDTKSDAYAQAQASLLRTFKSEFNSYVIPCYVASGKTGNPGELPYSIHNTLYLEVHCPTVKPPLVVISDNGRTTVDFGDVSIGQTVIKTATIQNIFEDNINVTASLLDPVGPFVLLNALRELEPEESLTVIFSFTPGTGRVYQEVQELRTGISTLYLNLVGRGVSPKVSLSLDTDHLDMGAVLENEYVEKTFKIKNTSTLAIDFSIKMDSNSLLRHALTQGIPQFVRRDQTQKVKVGVQNFNGQRVFDCVPCEGTIAPGSSTEIMMTYAPDHASVNYFDTVRIQLFGMEEQHSFQVLGQCFPHIMYVAGGDELMPDVESLTVLPGTEEEEEVKSSAIPVLLTFNSVSSEEGFSAASRELLVGCVRTMAVSQKKNGEFSFENTKDIEAKGFTLDPPKGQVEAGSKRPVQFTWNPPAGHDPNRPMEASILLTVKGDATDQYKVMLRAFVVSE